MLRILLFLAALGLIIIAVFAWTSWRFEQEYQHDVAALLAKTKNGQQDLLLEADLQPLPQPVQKYLRYVGVLNKPKVKNVRIVFIGQMRGKGQDWFPFQSEQYNSFEEYTRLFYMKGKLFGLTVPGYHDYQARMARMRIRLFGLFPVVEATGPELFQAETVTIFNDMCLTAPATLIDPRISWESLDTTTAKATFTNQDVTVHVTLHFNTKGQLINFVSDDRYDIGKSGARQYRFSTPVSEYKNFNGFNLASFGEAIWHYPDGKFTYGEFELQEVGYNLPAKPFLKN